MENSTKLCIIRRKDFRKLLKKMQRKKRRQKAAKELASQLEVERIKHLEDPQHQQWLNEQKDLEQKEKLQQEADEKAWLQRERLAQQQFARDQQHLKEVEAAKEQLKVKQLEYIEKVKKNQDKENRLEAEKTNAFENIMQRMEEYLSNPSAQIPTALRTFVETKPNQQLCAFYEHTNCCRYGLSCQYNHRRPMLSTILLIRNFFTHPLLKRSYHAEYESADTGLELTERDLREDYDVFFEDVTAEMESFGKILNFRTVRNLKSYLCGNVYVEYVQERSALNAFISLQGRWYAGKKISVEFSNLITWRSAVCGLSASRKCPKGNACNYLHLLQNPENRYNNLLDFTKLGLARITAKTDNETISATPTTWDDDEYVKGHKDKSRNWRWSESPEPHDYDEASANHKIIYRKRDSRGHNSKTSDAELRCTIKEKDDGKKDDKAQHLSSHRKRNSTATNKDIRAKVHTKNHSPDKSHKKPKIKHKENK